MNAEKIKKLEDEIKDLHYHPIQIKHGFSEKKTAEVFSNFWNYHISFVIKKSKEMSEKYGADKEVVWLSAILHDIARLDDIEPHDEIGSQKAYDLLIEKGFNNDLAEKVKRVILTHRCKKYPPDDIEQKIVATADAVSHFKAPFYLWVARDSKLPMVEMLEKYLNKIKRDYNEKLFFEDEKKEVQKEYEVLKKWFEYNV